MMSDRALERYRYPIAQRCSYMALAARRCRRWTHTGFVDPDSTHLPRFLCHSHEWIVK